VIYYPTVMARYSLFVLKVPLNPKQTNKQTSSRYFRVSVRVMVTAALAEVCDLMSASCNRFIFTYILFCFFLCLLRLH